MAYNEEGYQVMPGLRLEIRTLQNEQGYSLYIGPSSSTQATSLLFDTQKECAIYLRRIHRVMEDMSANMENILEDYYEDNSQEKRDQR